MINTKHVFRNNIESFVGITLKDIFKSKDGSLIWLVSSDNQHLILKIHRGWKSIDDEIDVYQLSNIYELADEFGIQICESVGLLTAKEYQNFKDELQRQLLIKKTGPIKPNDKEQRKKLYEELKQEFSEEKDSILRCGEY